MDSLQAREILMHFRPGTTDAADPRMAEALELVRRDPELAAWFEQHCATYLAIRAKLKGIATPPDLQRRIVVGRAGHIRARRQRIAVRVLLAAAAAVVLASIFWKFFMVSNEGDFNHFRSRMASKVQRPGSYMDYLSTNLADITAYFTTNNAPTNFTLPGSLALLPGEGGSVFKFNDKQVLMICLNSGLNAEGKTNDLWVFITAKASLPDPPIAGSTNFVRMANLMTASWTAGEEVYLVAGAGEVADLRKYLQ